MTRQVSTLNVLASSKQCNTPKIGLSIFVLLFLPSFFCRPFSPGIWFTTRRIQTILTLQPFFSAPLQGKIPPQTLEPGYARILPSPVQCSSYQLNFIDANRWN